MNPLNEGILDKRRPWTAVDEDRLLALRASQKSWAVIAVVLRRTMFSVEAQHLRITKKSEEYETGVLPMSRKRITHAKSFNERCIARADAKLDEANKLPPGSQRETLLREARQFRNAAQIDGWLASTELTAPT